MRAKSVCLAERPRSQHGRNIRSADTLRCRYSAKEYFHRQPSNDQIKRQIKTNNVIVKDLKRKLIEKKPCAISVQTLSIPMTYADNPKPIHSTSKRNLNYSSKGIDNKTKFSNPKQAGEKKLCQRVGGKETENKLLLQISEAEQVSDFERILNSNAILWERARGHVWRGSVAAHTPSASLLPRPRSSYSLRTVSQAYHTLFRQHEESLQHLIDRHREETAEHKNATSSLLENNWYENLQDLSEFYEDDQTLQKEIETITDKIIAEEVRSGEGGQTTARSNFNVNLAGLISLQVNGDGVSPTYRDDLGPSPEIDKLDTYDEKEWLAPSMTANCDEKYLQDNSETGIDNLAQNLNTIQIDCDGNIPTITFSNCCDGRSQTDNRNNSEVVIHLAVPSISNVDEARPPL